DVGKLLDLLKAPPKALVDWDPIEVAGVMTQSLWELFEAASLTADTSVLEEVCGKLLARLKKMGPVMALEDDDEDDDIITEGGLSLVMRSSEQLADARLRQQQHQLAVSNVLYIMTKLYDVPDYALLCLRIRCKYLGQTHPSTLEAFCNCAEEFITYENLFTGRLYRQALEQVRQAPELEKDKLGNLTLTLLYKYACFLYDCEEHGPFEWNSPRFRWLRWIVDKAPKEDNRREEACQKLRKVLECSKKERGDMHPFTITVRSSLARFLEEQDDLEGAEKEHALALEASKTTLGDDHIDTFWSRLGLARCQAKLKKYLVAMELFTEALKALDKSPQIFDKKEVQLEAEGRIADCLLGLGEFAKAEVKYLKVLEKYNASDIPLDLKINYARCLALQGKFPAAERVYREAFHGAYNKELQQQKKAQPLQEDICRGLKEAVENQGRKFDLEAEKEEAEEQQKNQAGGGTAADGGGGGDEAGEEGRTVRG
ncbi:hypothetical protein Vretifemale_7310, partial [Volvox reticuliferus]